MGLDAVFDQNVFSERQRFRTLTATQRERDVKGIKKGKMNDAARHGFNAVCRFSTTRDEHAVDNICQRR